MNKGYKLIDTEKWPRTEYFRHFMDEAPCSISMCDEIDVTRLKTACHTLKLSFYAAFLYVVSEIVNSHDELKMLAVDTPDSPYPLPAVCFPVRGAPVFIFMEQEEFLKPYMLIILTEKYPTGL